MELERKALPQEYYPKPLKKAIDGYEHGTPGLRIARENLAREVVRALNSKDPQVQVKAIIGLLEAIELRGMADRSYLRADFEERLTQMGKAV